MYNTVKFLFPKVFITVFQVLDITMKNCGEAMHVEVLTESFMEQIKELVKVISKFIKVVLFLMYW